MNPQPQHGCGDGGRAAYRERLRHLLRADIDMATTGTPPACVESIDVTGSIAALALLDIADALDSLTAGRP